VDRQFAGFRAEKITTDADVITEIEQPVKLKSALSDSVLFDVNLKSLTALLDVGKSGLAHEADGHDPSGNADVHPRMFQFFSRSDRVASEDLFDRVGVFVPGAVDRLSKRLNLFQLLAAQFVDVLVQG